MGHQPPTSYKKSASVKVGILSLLSIALLVVCLIWLRGKGLNAGQQYSVLFKDVDGMREGASVQMMGIRVGFVDRVAAINKNGKYFVQVVFNLNRESNVSIPKGARLSIEQSGLIGEKFLEITPPQLRSVTIDHIANSMNLKPGMPVRFLYMEGFRDVGTVEQVVEPLKVTLSTDEDTDKAIAQAQKMVRPNAQTHSSTIYYRILMPGAEMPYDPKFTIGEDAHHQPYLLITPHIPLLATMPDPHEKFTIENPMRLKEFLQIQMESAAALKITNDKINELLSDETIDTLNQTLKNTEILTAKANTVLDTANSLFASSSKDLEKLVATSSDLATHVNQVSKNLNDVIGDPQLKRDIIATVSSIQQSTQSINQILKDPSIKETIMLTRETTANTSELMKSLKETAQNKQLQERLDNSLTLLSASMEKLSKTLDSVQTLTNDTDVKGILQDSRDTAKNLKKASDKLGKHFALFRLMF